MHCVKVATDRTVKSTQKRGKFPDNLPYNARWHPTKYFSRHRFRLLHPAPVRGPAITSTHNMSQSVSRRVLFFSHFRL